MFQASGTLVKEAVDGYEYYFLAATVVACVVPPHSKRKRANAAAEWRRTVRLLVEPELIQLLGRYTDAAGFLGRHSAASSAKV